jgi:PAS domain S-box-containing protein
MTVRDFSAEAAVVGVIINFHDITERELALDELRRSEATLKESQATLERAQTLGHLGSWTIEGTAQDAPVTASAQTLRIYGVGPSTFTGDRSVFHRAFDPDEWSHAHGKIAAAAVAGGPFAYDARITRASGEDITARKRVEAELRASEARYRRIIETTAEGVWVCDTDRKTTFVNGRLAAMLGYQPAEMLGRSIMDFADLPVADTDAHFEQVQNAGGGNIESRFRKKDGTHVLAKLAWRSSSTHPGTSKARSRWSRTSPGSASPTSSVRSSPPSSSRPTTPFSPSRSTARSCRGTRAPSGSTAIPASKPSGDR